MASDDVTPRQRQVIEAIYQGPTARQAARRLGISYRTLCVHRANAYARLEVHRDIDAYARLGLISRIR